MPLSKVTFVWLVTAFCGLLLTLPPARSIYSPARRLRGRFWTLAVLFGENATVPLHLLSAAVGIVSALPVFSAVLKISEYNSLRELTSGQIALLVMTLVFRTFLWPAIGIDWTQVRRWEQEVVRRPRGGIWAYLRAPNDSARETLTNRAVALGRQLAGAESDKLFAFTGVPLKTTGLLLMYCAISAVPEMWADVRAACRALLLACCMWVLTKATPHRAQTHHKYKSFFLLTSTVPMGLVLFQTLTAQRPSGIELSQFLSHDLTRILLLSNVFLLTGNVLVQLLELKPAAAPEVGSSPVDRRYSFLKKVTQTSQWLVKPEHLLTLLMQTDILLATIRITASW